MPTTDWIPLQRLRSGHLTALGYQFYLRGEYQYYLKALEMDTPILREARQRLNLKRGWDLGESEVPFLHVFKRNALELFHKEIIGLVQMQKTMTARSPATSKYTVPIPVHANAVPVCVDSTYPNPPPTRQFLPLEELMY